MSGIDSFTTLCLHFDGADGSTTITDSSSHANTLVVNNAAVIGVAQSVFGGASLHIPNQDVSDSVIGTGPSSNYSLGAGDFVVDLRYRPAAFTSTAVIDWGFNISGQGATCPLLLQNGASIQWLFNGAVRITGPSLSADTWYHVAVVRSSGVSRMFIDGAQVGSDYTDSNNYGSDATNGIAVGMVLGAGASQSGWYDEVRFSKGTDRGWFSGFTPPVAAYSQANAFRKTLSLVGTRTGSRQVQAS